MSDAAPSPAQLRYETWQQANRLRREVLEADQLPDRALEDLVQAEAAHAEAVQAEAVARVQAEARAGTSRTMLLGAESTGIEADVKIAVSHVPTAICHLLDASLQPLVRCTVRNTTDAATPRRVRVTCWVDGYSAPTTDTVELSRRSEHTFSLLPTFFPDRLTSLTELTRATLVAQIDDLDGRVELHRSFPIWLLARTTAALEVHDPSSGKVVDLSPYLGAFVTPNAPAVLEFLRTVAARHESGEIVGYQGSKDVVAPQVTAVFDALKLDSGITYVNSVVAFAPEDGGTRQRVRLPRETLGDREANCLDGAVLVASLLEAMSLRPAIVLTPGHAFVGWETWPYSDEWRYFDTTMIGGTRTFAAAEQRGTSYAREFRKKSEASGDPYLFRSWPLVALRAERGIWPME